ncbi:unnamed protein product, partial [Ectocarpus sp. 8 AP-2014]
MSQSRVLFAPLAAFTTLSPRTLTCTPLGAMRGALSTLARGRAAGGMVVSVLGDTFADVVCRPLERLPAWGTDTLVSDPIRVMLGGSAANFAVHATNLNRAQPPFELLASAAPQDDEAQQLNSAAAAAAEAAACGEEAGAGAAAAAVESCEANTKKMQACVLHTSVASDDMGAFVRGKLIEHGVEWSQTKAREHQGACVVLSGREDRSFVTHRGSAALFCREDIDVPRLLESDHVHVGKQPHHHHPNDFFPGFYNCPALWKDLPSLLAEAKAGGSSCSLGPQWDATEEWGGLEPLYPYLDVFMPNEDEALNISGCDDVAEAASFFLDRGVGLVVVTRGGGGAFAASRRHGGGGTAGGRGSMRVKGGGGGGAAGGAGDNGGGEGGFQRSWEQKCVPVEVVDTTGAGDAF